MGPKQELLLQIRVDLGVMAMKQYSSLPKSQELQPHHQMQLSIIPKTLFFIFFFFCFFFLLYHFLPFSLITNTFFFLSFFLSNYNFFPSLTISFFLSITIELLFSLSHYFFSLSSFLFCTVNFFFISGNQLLSFCNFLLPFILTIIFPVSL